MDLANLFRLFSIIFVVALYMGNRNVSSVNGNSLLGASLPPHALSDGAVTHIVKGYRRTCLLISIIFLAFAMHLSLFAYAPPLGSVCFMAWIVVYLHLNQRTFYRCLKKLLKLKSEKNWQCEAHQVSVIDTFSFAKAWFALPLSISAIPLLAVWIYPEAGLQRVYYIPLFYGTFLIQVLSFLCFLIFSRGRTKICHDNDELAITIRHVCKREWSKCWVMVAILIAFFSMWAAWLWSDSAKHDLPIWAILLFCGIVGLLILVPVLSTKLNDADIRKCFGLDEAIMKNK